MKKLKSRRLSKKAKFLLLVGLPLLVLGAYVGYSAMAWQGYKESVGQIVSRQDRLRDALGEDKLEWGQLADRVTTYRKDVLGSSCDTPPLVGWQQLVVSDWRLAVERCQDKRGESVDLATRLGEAVDYINFDRQVAGVLKPLVQAPDTMVAQADWASMYEAWRLADERLTGIDVPAGAELVYNSALQAVRTVAGAWEALIEANEAEDSAKFMTKQSELTDAYGAFDDLRSVSTDYLSQVAGVLED